MKVIIEQKVKKECFIRACKSNKEGICINSEWFFRGCALTWFLTGEKPQTMGER